MPIKAEDTEQKKGPDIEAWFQRWFHGQPGISDNHILWEHFQQAKKDLLGMFTSKKEA